MSMYNKQGPNCPCEEGGCQHGAGRVNICFAFYMSFNIVDQDLFVRMLL